MVVSAAFVQHGTTVATGVASETLSGFPVSGTDFAILTTGDATIADSPGADAVNTPSSGKLYQGAFDATVLKIGLQIPDGATCLSFDFRFLSAEFPAFVGTQFSDAFIAELDHNTWSVTNGHIQQGDNFAFDSTGAPITVSAAGDAALAAGAAAGTPYGGATPMLRASHPVTPGTHTLYLSIFDVGDALFDSAVFLDNIAIASVPASACVRGAALAQPIVASVAMTRPSYTVLQAAEAVVQVADVSGAPAANLAVAFQVRYFSGNDNVDSALAFTPCATWTSQGTTDASGQARFAIPQAIAARCAGLASLMELPTDALHGHYAVTVSTARGADLASSGTTYQVTVV